MIDWLLFTVGVPPGLIMFGWLNLLLLIVLPIALLWAWRKKHG